MPNEHDRDWDRQNPFVTIAERMGQLSANQSSMLNELTRMNNALLRLEADMNRKHEENIRLITETERTTIHLIEEQGQRISSLEKWRTGISYVIAFVAAAWGALMGWLGLRKGD